MSRQLRVDYSRVYELVASQKSNISSNIEGEARTAFTQATRMLEDVDGATNHELIELTERSKLKANAAADVLRKLANYIESSTRTLEKAEAQIARGFNTGR